MTDTTPKRLRELAEAALCSTAFVPKELLLALADEKEAQHSTANVPLPEPYAWRAVGGSIWGHKTSEDDTPMYDLEALRQYGQACAKAARDAAFDECEKLLSSMYSEAIEAVEPHQEPYYDGWLNALDVATTRIQAAKKGAT